MSDMKTTVHIKEQVHGAIGSIDFDVDAGEIAAADLHPAVLAHLLEFGYAEPVAPQKKSTATKEAEPR